MRTIKKLWWDTVFGTIFIFGLMGLFGSMTALNIFDAFDPVGEALAQMEMTDIVFSQLREDPVADDRIVLVNLGDLGRADIAIMLNIINQYNPAVVGFDSFFNFPKEDTLADLMLAEAFANTKNLVLATKLVINPETDDFDSVHYSYELFSQFGHPAFANLDTEAKDQDDLKFCRSFWPEWTVNDERQLALAVRMAQLYDSVTTEKFLERKYQDELINFRGNVMDFGATKFGTAFSAIDWNDVFEENFVPEMVEGKIVLFCYLGDYLGDRKSLEDKFITPLNERYVGRTLPDMFGGVIHANIISMILYEDYINYMTELQGIFWAIIICFINVFFFTWIYRVLPKWYDGLTKLIQLIELGTIFTLMIFMFHLYSYKLDMTIAMVAIALAGDSLEVYHGVVKNLFTREGRRSLTKRDKL